jgi:hypothetical protein
MTTSKSLPARPSLESLRKQAKKLAREASLSHRGAQLPQLELTLHRPNDC